MNLDLWLDDPAISTALGLGWQFMSKINCLKNRSDLWKSDLWKKE